MKHDFFPASLVVEGRDCLVVGNDHEAVEKTERLVKAGAKVQILDPEKFSLGDLKGQFFVVFCPKDQPEIARQVFEECRRQKILLCAIDQPQYCDIVNVSVYERGDLKIMLSTNGVAPALAKKIRQGLEASLSHVPIEKFMNKLFLLRQQLEHEIPDVKIRRQKLIAEVSDVEFKAELKLPPHHD